MEQVSSLKTGIKYKETPIGRIPVDWEAVTLSKIAEINMGQSPSSKDCNEKRNGLPFYQRGAEFGELYPSPQRWCIRPKKAAYQNDILISIREPVGEVNIAPHQCCIGRGIAAVKAKDVPIIFLFHTILFHRKTLSKIAQEKSFGTINSKELSSLLIALPPLPEQKKISLILATFDETIERTTEIIEKLKKLGKGPIQGMQKDQREIAEILSPICDLREKESNYKKHLEILRKVLSHLLLTGKIRVAV